MNRRSAWPRPKEHLGGKHLAAVFGFCAVLLLSTRASGDVASLTSTLRTTSFNCTPPLDTSIQNATGSAAIPPGSLVTSLTFNAVDTCGTTCGANQYRIWRISVCHGGICRLVPNGTFHDFDGQDASTTWSTGLDLAEWGCPNSFYWSFTITYNPPPLRVDSLSNDYSPPEGGRTYQIRGAGFAPGASVRFGGIQSPSVEYVNSGLLNAVAPAHSPGYVPVSVTVGSQTATWAGQFLYAYIPTFVSIAPDHGRTAGGQDVTITGTHFAQGEGSDVSVSFNSLLATNVRVVNDTTIIATTPANPAGSVFVGVRIYHRVSDGRYNAFTFYPDPTVSAVSPASGPDTGGIPVTISGTNFAPGATVSFGGVPATNVTFVDAQTLQAITPPHAIGPVDVAVTAHDQTGSLANAFNYYSAVQIMSLINALLD